MPEYRVGVWLEECVQITIKADTAEEAEKLGQQPSGSMTVSP